MTALTPGGAIKWTYLTSDCSRTGPPFPLPRLCSVESSPAVGGDGTVYVGSYALDTSVNPPVVYGYVSAIDDAGALKWRYDLGGCELSGCEVLSSPAIGADGAVYVGSGAYVYAFGPGPNSASAP